MKTLIQGPSLCCFWGLFEQDFGDPTTESPMRTITPSFVGNSMLPFRCPRCKDVCQDLACPLLRDHYHDQREGRDNHFCPRCGCRFKISMSGMPLPCAIQTGADVGPSKVEYNNEVIWQDRTDRTTSTIIGILFAPYFKTTTTYDKTKNGYHVLATRR